MTHEDIDRSVDYIRKLLHAAVDDHREITINQENKFLAFLVEDEQPQFVHRVSSGSFEWKVTIEPRLLVGEPTFYLSPK